MTDALTELADRLYALPPQRFVAERDAAAAAARAGGDTATATALRKLRRPTVAAWLVNLLALRRPELLGELAELADALRAAQQQLDGAQLRELANQRRAAVSGLVATARTLAQEVEPSLPVGKLPLAEVEGVLGAALGDRQVAAQVRSGRMVRTPSPEGFGELPRARLRLVPGGADGDAAAAAGQAPTPGDAPATRAAVAAALAQAHTAATAAQAELARAEAAQQATRRSLAEIDSELADLSARRSRVAAELAEAEGVVLAARRHVVATRRQVGDAEAAQEALDSGESSEPPGT